MWWRSQKIDLPSLSPHIVSEAREKKEICWVSSGWAIIAIFSCERLFWNSIMSLRRNRSHTLQHYKMHPPKTFRTFSFPHDQQQAEIPGMTAWTYISVPLPVILQVYVNLGARALNESVEIIQRPHFEWDRYPIAVWGAIRAEVLMSKKRVFFRWKLEYRGNNSLFLSPRISISAGAYQHG